MPEHPKAPDIIGLVRDPLTGMWALWNRIDDDERDVAAQYLRATPARAAAPQMLEALRKADKAFSHESMEMMGGLWPMTRAAVRDAIAAAEGEKRTE